MSIIYYDHMDGEPYRRARVAMENTVNALYIERMEAEDRKERIEVEKRINEEVEVWNRKWGKGPDYLDLHGMTLYGAKDFVARTVKRKKGPKLFLEVGVGNRSNGGFPAIKSGLRKKYGKAITVHLKNPGILVLNLTLVRMLGL